MSPKQSVASLKPKSLKQKVESKVIVSNRKIVANHEQWKQIQCDTWDTNGHDELDEYIF